MTAEINAIIERDLPAQVGAVLKKTLEQAQIDSATVKTQANEILELRSKCLNFSNIIGDYKQKEIELNQIKAQIEKLEKLERERKVFEAETKLNESEKRANEIAGFVGMVFKSPVYRTYVSESKNYMTHYNNNGTQEQIESGKFLDKTQSQE